MFDNLVAAHGRTPRRRARTIVVTTSVIVHAVVVATLAIVAMWRIDKLDLGYNGSRVNALNLPRNTGGGARPKVAALVPVEKPKVIPDEPVQPVKQVAKEKPTIVADLPDEGADGAGDAPPGDGGGGDGKGVGKPTTDQPCEGEKCLGGGTDGGGEEPHCKLGEQLIDGMCIKPKKIETVTVAPDVMKGLRKSGNDQIAAPQSVRVSMLHENKTRVVGTVKLCIGTDGGIDRAQLLKSTGYDAYDDLLLSEMKSWRYKPYTVDGEAVPACTAITIVYVMK